FAAHAGAAAPPASVDAARATVSAALPVRELDKLEVYAALGTLTRDIGERVKAYGAISHVPAAATPNMRNDMYMSAEDVRRLTKDKDKAATLFPAAEAATLKAYQSALNSGTRFIPDWVKVCVAIALGLGTMVGWKRIVVTVGERIGKT